MRKNAVIPYALIAGIGILMIIVISFVGLNQQEAIQEDDEQQEEQDGDQEDQDGGDSSGEETSVDGEEVFQSNCASCHGQDLSGDVGPALDTVGSDHSKEDIKGIIDEGPGSMPAGVVEGEEQDAVAEWLSEQK